MPSNDDIIKALKANNDVNSVLNPKGWGVRATKNAVFNPMNTMPTGSQPMARFNPGVDLPGLRAMGVQGYTPPVNENTQGQMMTPGERLNYIARNQSDLHDPTVPKNVKAMIHQEIKNHYQALGADLPEDLKNYVPWEPDSTPKGFKPLRPEEGSGGGAKINPLDALKIDPDKLLE